MDHLSVKSMVGVTVGGLMGLLFFLSCVISVVKAVRDRQRIKAQIKAKRARLSNGDVNHRALANGYNDRSRGKKGRPNIVIIHDEEREERVKRGSRKQFIKSTGTSFFSVSSPATGVSSISNPAAGQTSTKIAKLADVKMGQCPSMHGGSANGGNDDNIYGDRKVFSDGDCLPGQQRKRGSSNAGLVIPGNETEKATLYRVSSSSRKTGVPLISTFPVPITTVVDSVPFSNHNTIHTGSQQKYILNETKPLKLSEWKRSFCSFHGFTLKAGKAKANPYLGRYAATECSNGRLTPRRKSEAASDGSDLIWSDSPPLRRHSDEPRRISHDSISFLCHNAVRMRQIMREGADNPAYETLDNAD